MNALLDEYTDAQVAAVLNERGLWTGTGETFDSGSVQWVRFSAGLTSFKERLLAAGMLTGTQIAAKLGVRRTTIGRWRRKGRLTAGSATRWATGCTRARKTFHPTARVRANALRRVPRITPLQEVQYEKCSFAIDVLVCPRCAGPRRILGEVTEPHAVQRRLGVLGLAAQPPPRLPGSAHA